MSNIHPIGLATAIAPNQAIVAICGGQEFAVWRDSHGALHANQNRCPHRGMRLHLGFVRDDRLHCAYHGWSYDGGGQCRQIPAHPQLAPAKTICLQTYPVVERHALLWLAADADRVALDAGLATTVLPAGIDATPVRSLYVEAEMAVVRRAMATLHVPPCAEPDAASALLDADSESATWSVGERRVPVVYMRTLAAPGVGTIVVRGEGLRPQGLLYALQNAGRGRTGIHVCALWEGAAPVAYRRLLSRHLRRVEWFLSHADEPTGPWRAFAAAAA